MLLWVVAAGCWTIVAGGVAGDGGGGGGGGGVAFAAAAQGVLGGRPPRQRATAAGSRGLQAGMGKKNRRARLFKDTPEREPTEASRRLREASKRRPRSTGTASDQEPRQTALGRRNVGTVAGNHASGLLRITRADIEGSLACSDKNLARFCKQVSFADCGLAFLDRTGGGEYTRTHARARAHTHTHTFFPQLHRWRPSGYRHGYQRAAHNGVGVLLESRCQWLVRVRVRPVPSKL